MAFHFTVLSLAQLCDAARRKAFNLLVISAAAFPRARLLWEEMERILSGMTPLCKNSDPAHTLSNAQARPQASVLLRPRHSIFAFSSDSAQTAALQQHKLTMDPHPHPFPLATAIALIMVYREMCSYFLVFDTSGSILPSLNQKALPFCSTITTVCIVIGCNSTLHGTEPFLYFSHVLPMAMPKAIQ